MNDLTDSALYSQPIGCLYPAGMAKRKLMNVQDARQQFAERLDRLQTDAEHPDIEHTVVARRGRPVGVLVDIDWYRRMADADGDPTEF